MQRKENDQAQTNYCCYTMEYQLYVDHTQVTWERIAHSRGQKERQGSLWTICRVVTAFKRYPERAY